MGPSHTRLTLAGQVLALAALLATLAACGDDSSEASPPGGGEESHDSTFAEQPLEDILAAVQDDTGAAESVHVEGTVTDDKEKIELDLGVSRDGECSGIIRQDQAELELLAAEGRVFFRPDAAFFEATGLSAEEAAQLVETVGDRWIENEGSGFGEICDLDELLEDDEDGPWGDFEDKDAKASVNGTSEVAGTEVVELRSEKEGDSLSLFVSVAEPHYLVQVTGGEDDQSGDMTFTEWDEPLQTEVPADSEIFVPPNS
jgi:hypothetical protein